MNKGYRGQILRINLDDKSYKKESLDDQLLIKYLGGTGLASYFLYHEVGAEVEPLSSENKLFVFTGPLTGTLWPQGNRYVVTTKSPLTGIWGEAHSAGHWAPELKFAGYDGLVLEGSSAEPVYIYINNDRVLIKEATHIWGKTVHETEDIIKNELGSDVRIISIGPSGEKLVLISSIVNDRDRVAARSGVGAVMGSKKVKAIVVKGNQGIEVFDKINYLPYMKELIQKLIQDPIAGTRVIYGTAGLTEIMSEIGRLPTNNLRSGYFKDAHLISGKELRDKYLIKPRADFSCAQRCGRYCQVKEGKYSCITGGPEFETVAALGSRCGVNDLEAIIYAGYLCNNLGLDTIGTGAVISFAMELADLGLLPVEYRDDLDLFFGDAETVVELTKRIAYREGPLANLLAEGSFKAAQIIGGEAINYVMAVKKMEIAGQEPRGQKSMGLAIAVSARGADHLYAFPVLDEGGFDEEVERIYGAKYMPEMADRLNPVHKGHMIYVNENWGAVVESSVVCKYGTMVPPTLGYEELTKALKLTVGWDYSIKELEKLGERIINLQRMYNVRLGLSRKEDTLPERLLKEKATEGGAKGQVVELSYMLDDYYKERGWTLDGIPRPSTLKELGLDELIPDLPEGYYE